MIERYALPEIAGLFTDEARFRAWLEVEILATEAGSQPAWRLSGPDGGSAPRR